MPAQPSATSTRPSRQGRPKVSLTITASGPAPRARSASRSRRAERVGIDRQQHGDVGARRVREIDARVRAHEAVARLADQHAVCRAARRARSRAAPPRCGADPCRPRPRCAAPRRGHRRRRAPRGGPRPSRRSSGTRPARRRRARRPRARGGRREQRGQVVARRDVRNAAQRREPARCALMPAPPRASAAARARVRAAERCAGEDRDERRRRTSTSIASEGSASSSKRTPARSAASRCRFALSGPKRAGITSRGTRSSAEVPPSRDGASATPPAGHARSSRRTTSRGRAPATSPSTTSTPRPRPAPTIARPLDRRVEPRIVAQQRPRRPPLARRWRPPGSGVTTATRAELRHRAQRLDHVGQHREREPPTVATAALPQQPRLRGRERLHRHDGRDHGIRGASVERGCGEPRGDLAASSRIRVSTARARRPSASTSAGCARRAHRARSPARSRGRARRRRARTPRCPARAAGDRRVP